MADGRPERAAYGIRAVDRVCDLLDALGDADAGLSLTDLARLADLPKSSTLRYLSALEQRHYVGRVGADGNFTLGPAFRTDRRRYLDQLGEAAAPLVERLRDQCEETVNLGVVDGTRVVHVIVAESRKHVRLAAHTGEAAPVHATAIGKAALTTQSEGRVRAILAATGMPAITDRTITDPDTFVDEVRKCAERGYALDDLENQPDGRCVAVPLSGLALPAALSVSAPENRMPPRQVPSVAEQLHVTAAAIIEAARYLDR